MFNFGKLLTTYVNNGKASCGTSIISLITNQIKSVLNFVETILNEFHIMNENFNL